MKKRILSMLLALVFVLALIPVSTASASGDCGGDLYWELGFKSNSSCATLIFYGGGEMYDYSSDNLPPWHGYPIDEVSFNEVMPGDTQKYITSIGDYAFYECANLQEIVIPNDVHTIGKSAFYGCTGLTEIEIPDSVISIGSSAFSDCTGITRVNIPNSVIEMEAAAFYSCENLEEITIGNGIKVINPYTFAYCTNLKTITLSNEIAEIKRNAFNNCRNLTDVHYTGSEEDWNNIYIEPRNDDLLNATIHYNYVPDTNIASGTCGDNATWVIDEYGVLTVTGIGMLSGNKKITGGTIIIPGTSTVPGIATGGNMTGMAAPWWDYPWYEYREYINEIYIDPQITGINGHAFYDCYNAEKVNLENVTTIGPLAFYNCHSLEEIAWSDQLTTIDYDAFTNCTALKEITLPDKLTELSSSAFRGCTELKAVYTSELSENYYSDNGVLYNKDKTTLVFYPPQKEGSTYSILEDTTTIAERAFENAVNLQELNIPDTVTTINRYAFSNMCNLKKITLPSKLTEISEAMFSDSKNLTDVVFPDNVQIIGYNAFMNCSGLTELVIPDSVTTISACAFIDCTGLTNITFSDNITQINSGAFEGCTGLTNVTLPNKLTIIDSEIFANCSNLTSVTIGSGTTQINYYAFYGCNNITDLYYKGTEEEWNAISKENDATGLENATIHYIPKNQFVITYDSNGGSSVSKSTDSISYGENADLTVTAQKDGWFLGWNTSPDATEPIPSYTITENTTLYAVWKPSSPTIAVSDNNGLKAVAMSCSTDGVSIYYTTDGSTPTADSTLYTEPFTITGNENVTVKAIAVAEGYADSDITTKEILLNKLTPPVSDIVTGLVRLNTEVKLSASDGAIHYTTDGSIPTAESAVYSEPIILTESMTVTAIAIKDGMKNSDPVVFLYTVADENSPYLWISSELNSDGTAVTVKVNITANSKSSGGRFNLIYDNKTLQIASSKSSVMNSTINEKYTDNTLRIVWAGAQEINYAGEILSVTFDIVGDDKESLIYIDGAKLSDTNGVKFDVQVVNAMVKLYRDTVPTTGITLDSKKLDLFVGDTATLTATVSPENATNKNVTWISSDESVATVSNGKVTAISAGHATITAKQENTTCEDTCTVVVTDPVADGLVDSGTDANGIKWCFYESGLLKISGSGQMQDYSGTTSIPWYGEKANIFEIEISDGITHIGNRSFYNCISAKKVTIPESVTSIGTYAFRNCSEITIYGENGSYAETYAKANSIPFNDTSVKLLPEAIVDAYSNTSKWFFDVSVEDYTEEATVYVAIYDENSKMLTSTSDELLTDDITTLFINKAGNSTAVSAKVYVWNNSAHPVAKCAYVTLP